MESISSLKNKSKTIEEPVKKEEMWIFTDIECRWIRMFSSHGIHYSKHSITKSFNSFY